MMSIIQLVLSENEKQWLYQNTIHKTQRQSHGLTVSRAPPSRSHVNSLASKTDINFHFTHKNFQITNITSKIFLVRNDFRR